MALLKLTDTDQPIILALTSPERYRENSISLLREILGQNRRVIFIAIHQPSSSLREYYTKAGIDVTEIFFIDAITKYAIGSVPESRQNVVYLGNPGDHTALGIAITDSFKNAGDKLPVLYLDSINAMLIYSTSVNLSRFIHFVTSKLRLRNVAGILIAVEKGLDPLLLSQLTAFSDAVIDISGDTGAGSEKPLPPL
jgi:KaiC/GvpD/RAD55 family RecA-like ATPase